MGRARMWISRYTFSTCPFGAVPTFEKLMTSPWVGHAGRVNPSANHTLQFLPYFSFLLLPPHENAPFYITWNFTVACVLSWVFLGGKQPGVGASQAGRGWAGTCWALGGGSKNKSKLCLLGVLWQKTQNPPFKLLWEDHTDKNLRKNLYSLCTHFVLL